MEEGGGEGGREGGELGEEVLEGLGVGAEGGGVGGGQGVQSSNKEGERRGGEGGGRLSTPLLLLVELLLLLGACVLGEFDDGPEEGGEDTCLSFWDLSIHDTNPLYCQVAQEGGREGGREGGKGALEPGEGQGVEFGGTLEGEAAEETTRGIVVG